MLASNKRIIKAIIPLILGNLYNKNTVGMMRMLIIIRGMIKLRVPIVHCINNTAVIEKNPHIIEIIKKFLTNSGSFKGPFARINLGNVNAAPL